MIIPAYKLNIKKAYSYPAERLRKKGSVIFFNLCEENELSRIISLSKKDVVLDACCGYGRWAVKVSKKVEKVIAVDLSETFTDDLKKRKLPNVEVLCTDLSLLDFKDFFDVIIFSAALEHFKDKRRILQKLHRMLGPGGKLYISCWTSDMLSPLRKHRGARPGEMKIGDRSWYIEEPTIEELIDHLKRAGFKNIFTKEVYANTKMLSEDSIEVYADYILKPRMVNLVNLAEGEK